MDFIENCDVMVSPGDTADDDVFVNLDAFDMLGDFPDLEVLDATVRHPILQVFNINNNNIFLLCLFIYLIITIF